MAGEKGHERVRAEKREGGNERAQKIEGRREKIVGKTEHMKKIKKVRFAGCIFW